MHAGDGNGRTTHALESHTSGGYGGCEHHSRVVKGVPQLDPAVLCWSLTCEAGACVLAWPLPPLLTLLLPRHIEHI